MQYDYKATVALITIGLIIGMGALSKTFAADMDHTKPMRVGLLELYTSEGCSSCPPADSLISNLPRPQLVPTKLVVLAFHVDYWNYLGWKDRFSQRQFTERQQTLVRATDLPTAYTPQFVFNGRDYRERGTIEAKALGVNDQPATVRITLETVLRVRALHINVLIEPTVSQPNKASLYVALYENNLETPVQAGENRGRRLKHDYVVRLLLDPTSLTFEKPQRLKREVVVAEDWKIEDIGVAAFVQSDSTGEILQATAQLVQRP